MFRICICDDESQYVNQIEKEVRKLSEDKGEVRIDTFTNQDDLLIRSTKMKFNLVYLDIEMEGMNGIEVAKKLKESNPSCIIVFVTAYDGYIQDAFKVEAFQYLMKPINAELFKEEFERAYKLYKRTNLVRKFKMKDGYITININEIISLESYYNTAILKTTKGTYITNYKNMRKIRKELLEHDFLKLQAGYVVNMHYILSIRFREAELITGQKYPVSMENYTKVLERYHKFLEELK